ncbi:MAG: hypothetical protein AMJ43_04305 [Coxiella sp. DG_40]|nr:MAG: hypothetical protein AMJ43_04305 [Coxiella sp. DG_40]
MIKKGLVKNFNELVAKADQMKKQDKMDLSCDQDLTFAIMNLVSIEEHFIFTGVKTGKNKYCDFVNEVRKVRKELLQKLVKEPEGEVWCISKHLLATTMRLMEVGTKQLGINKKQEAYDFFQKAYDVYSLFWGLNMKLIDTGDIKNIDEMALSKHDKRKNGVVGKLGNLVKRAINCCIE